MIVNAIRFLETNSQEWQAYRFSMGTGSFRNFMCISGNRETVENLRAALIYGLTGQQEMVLAEVSIQLGDDAGNSWVVHRSDSQVSYLKNGSPIESKDGKDLLNALLDLDAEESSTELGVDNYQIKPVNGAFLASDGNESQDPKVYFRHIVSSQIRSLAEECAANTGIESIAHPPTLSKLVRAIEPIVARYKDFKVQVKEFSAEYKSVEGIQETPSSRIVDELEAIDRIAQLSEPLLNPSTSLKTRRNQLKSVEKRIGALTEKLGLDQRLFDVSISDWRRPLESLCRMEAYAKLVKSSESARKYCIQKVEPSFKGYIGAIQKSVDRDKVIAGELESCLASLNLYVDKEDSENAIRPKNWFEKFKSKQSEGGTSSIAQSQLDTIRMAIEYVLGRLNAMQERALEAGAKHDSVQGRIDESHEELVQTYGRLRDHWLKTAQAYQLPEDLNINSLVSFISAQTQLFALNAERKVLIEQVEVHRNSLKELKEVIEAWRKNSNTSRETGLSTESLILNEARAILKIRSKRKRDLQEWHQSAAAIQAVRYLRNTLKAKKRQIVKDWSEVFKSMDLEPLPLDAPYWTSVLNRAQLMRSLALIHGSTGSETQKMVFDQKGEIKPMCIYTWFDKNVASNQRLEFLKCVETAAERALPTLYFLLVEDDGLREMMRSLGIGVGSAVKVAAKIAPTMEEPKPKQVPTASQLNERARSALEILTGQKS